MVWWFIVDSLGGHAAETQILPPREEAKLSQIERDTSMNCHTPSRASSRVGTNGNGVMMENGSKKPQYTSSMFHVLCRHTIISY